MIVDAVEERVTDPLLIPFHRGGGTGTLVAVIAIPATGAFVLHGRHKHEIGRKGEGARCLSRFPYLSVVIPSD